MNLFTPTTHAAFSYQYCLHPDEPKLILVRKNIRGSIWQWYGAFQSEQSAAIALESLRMAQARERVGGGRA